ncbi:MAG: hypothetical protein HWN80_20140 [Candidatus Lokiarchaeota archaeon]|nr:hypothetical protein [Candidatus Lokiarchaeota archaeon]
MNKNLKLNKGISAIEILIVIAIISIASASLLGIISYSLKISTSIKQTTIANNLAQEAMEAVRNIRDDSWDKISTAITTGEDYHPEIDTSTTPPKWKLVPDPETIDGLTRKIVFNNVERDNNHNIVESGGAYIDSETKRVTVTVSWNNKNIKLVTYFTNWKGQ